MIDHSRGHRPATPDDLFSVYLHHNACGGRVAAGMNGYTCLKVGCPAAWGHGTIQRLNGAELAARFHVREPRADSDGVLVWKTVERERFTATVPAAEAHLHEPFRGY